MEKTITNQDYCKVLLRAITNIMKAEEIKKLSVKQYLNKITQHLYDLINDHRIARRVWKIQISMRVNFISSKDTGETRTIYVWSNNESIMWGNDTNNIIKEFFESFLNNYQEELKLTSGSELDFESVELMDKFFTSVKVKLFC